MATNARDRYEKYISVTGPAISGYFAVMYWWNDKEDFLEPGEGFWEPWQTGLGRYRTKEEAIEEGKIWAALEEMEFIE